jgi:DNA modification methylase
MIRTAFTIRTNLLSFLRTSEKDEQKEKAMKTCAVEIHLGDSRQVLKQFPDGHFNLIVTSPPYADARKNHYDSIKPSTYEDFILSFHEEFRHVLADDGSFVLNIKDKVVDGTGNRFVWPYDRGSYK